MVIIGGVAVTIPNCFVVFPETLVILTVKLNVPAVVGVPEIMPVDVFKLRPGGRLPLEIAHVIGVIPVALRFWL